MAPPNQRSGSKRRLKSRGKERVPVPITSERGSGRRHPKPKDCWVCWLLKDQKSYSPWVQARLTRLQGLEGQSCQHTCFPGATAWCLWPVSRSYRRAVRKGGWTAHSQVATKPWKVYTGKSVPALHVKNVFMSEFTLTVTNLSYGLLPLTILGNSLIGSKENSVIICIFGGHNSKGKLSCRPFQNMYQLKNLIIRIKGSNQACHLVLYISLIIKIKQETYKSHSGP